MSNREKIKLFADMANLDIDLITKVAIGIYNADPEVHVILQEGRYVQMKILWADLAEDCGECKTFGRLYYMELAKAALEAAYDD